MLTIAIIVFSWLIVCGLVKPSIQRRLSKHCVWSRHDVGQNTVGERVYRPCFEHHHADAIIYSIAGPIIVPFAIGSIIGSIGSGPSRQEKKQQREIDAANHRKKLADISLETTKVKEKEAGIK